MGEDKRARINAFIRKQVAEGHQVYIVCPAIEAQEKDEDGSVGRKLDFLVQEMNREVNTIGSKVQDVGITAVVVEMKSEIEKIREQIQNIE